MVLADDGHHGGLGFPGAEPGLAARDDGVLADAVLAVPDDPDVLSAPVLSAVEPVEVVAAVAGLDFFPSPWSASFLVGGGIIELMMGDLLVAAGVPTSAESLVTPVSGAGELWTSLAMTYVRSERINYQS